MYVFMYMYVCMCVCVCVCVCVCLSVCLSVCLYVFMCFALIDALPAKEMFWVHTHAPKDIILIDQKQLLIMITFLC